MLEEVGGDMSRQNRWKKRVNTEIKKFTNHLYREIYTIEEDELLLEVGANIQTARFLGRTLNSVQSRLWRIRHES